MALAAVHCGQPSFFGAAHHAIQQRSSVLLRQRAALFIELTEFFQQRLLGAQANAAAEVGDRRLFRVAVQYMQKLQRRAQTLRSPGGVVANAGRVSRTVDAGNDFIHDVCLLVFNGP
ncbi:hypothetical protein D9M73_98950 [compost metagenome]